MTWLMATSGFILGATALLWSAQIEFSLNALTREFIAANRRPAVLAGNSIFALNTVLLFQNLAFSELFILLFMFSYSLYAVVWSDIRHKLIPDWIIVFLLVLVAVRLLLQLGEPWQFALYGALALGLSTGLVHFINKDAIGLGDVKLLAAVGLFFGLWDGLVIMMLALVLSGLTGLFLLTFKLAGRNTSMPFAPFVGVSLVLYLLL